MRLVTAWTEAERQQVIAWLEEHGIDHTVVPYDTPFRWTAGNPPRWEIEQWIRKDDGHYELDQWNQPVRRTVRFVEKAPWPLDRKAHDPIAAAEARGWQAAIAALGSDELAAKGADRIHALGCGCGSADAGDRARAEDALQETAEHLTSVAPKEGDRT